MKNVALLFAAGTNCDREMAWAFELVGSRVSYIHINQAKADPTCLRRYEVLGIPGGFTYGDYIAAGRILANELRFRLRDEITRFVGEGKLIIGVCNGFQVLVKAGILPGVTGCFADQSVTLETNDSDRFEDRWVWLRVGTRRCVFLSGIEKDIYLPVAHAEGKLVARSRETTRRLDSSGLVALRYVRPGSARCGYPWNPNGSWDDIAGICDPSGRVFGLMPHPERFLIAAHHPRWTRGPESEPDGLAIYRNAVEYARKNL